MQQHPSQVPQQHVLVRMSHSTAQVHGLLDQQQSIAMVTLQIQDGGQVAHQHQRLTGDMRVSIRGSCRRSPSRGSQHFYLWVGVSLLLAADVEGLLVVLLGLAQPQGRRSVPSS